MSLHPKQRQLITEELSKSLPDLTVKNNMFLEAWDVALRIIPIESKLERHGKNRTALEAILGEFPLVTFVRDQLAAILLELDCYETEPIHRPLSESLGRERCAQIADGLTEELCTLPWQYSLTLELPERLSTELRQIVSSDLALGAILLSVNSLDADAKLPIRDLEPGRNKRLFSSGNLLALFSERDENPNRSWKRERARISASANGYIDVYGTSQTAFEFETTIKSFFGLCFALRILRFDRRYGQHRPKSYVFAHRQKDAKAELIHRYAISERLAGAIDDCLAYFSETTDEQKRQGAISWASSRLLLMEKVFGSQEKNQRLLTACAWLFDSTVNDDNLLGFVQAMVVLEILLGDDVPSGELTLGALLRNRCAYLISESIDEREDIKKKLKEIYDVRSKIVHRGKSKLSISEHSMLTELRGICHRVIHEEFNLTVGQRR